MELSHRYIVEYILLSNGGSCSYEQLLPFLKTPLAIQEAVNEINQASSQTGRKVTDAKSTLLMYFDKDVIQTYKQERNDYKNNLTEPQREVLACIFYQNPCSKYDIDSLRGVDSVLPIRELVRKKYIIETQKDTYTLSAYALAHLDII